MMRRLCDLLAACWPCALALLPTAVALFVALLASLGVADVG